MKINIEYEGEEYTNLVDMVNNLIGVLGRHVDHTHKERMARIQSSRAKTVSSILSDYDSEDYDEPMSFESFKTKKEEGAPFSSPDFQDPSQMSVYAERGKKAFEDLIELWLINFDQEGEQPPRADKCEELTQSYDGRAIIHYMEYVRNKYPNGGLTFAIRDSGLVSQEQTRLMAENMTAVSSACRFTQLASYLEHPDPSKEEDFFNV